MLSYYCFIHSYVCLVNFVLFFFSFERFSFLYCCVLIILMYFCHSFMVYIVFVKRILSYTVNNDIYCVSFVLSTGDICQEYKEELAALREEYNKLQDKVNMMNKVSILPIQIRPLKLFPSFLKMVQFMLLSYHFSENRMCNCG